MAMDVSSRSGSAQRAALAFRSVAEAWMDARNDASSLAMCMCAVDVFALGALWYVTGDLAAPAAAALAINAVDAIQMHKVGDGQLYERIDNGWHRHRDALCKTMSSAQGAVMCAYLCVCVCVLCAGRSQA